LVVQIDLFDLFISRTFFLGFRIYFGIVFISFMIAVDGLPRPERFLFFFFALLFFSSLIKRR